MDTMQLNKISAAVLVSCIAFFMAGRISDVLIPETTLKQSAIKIEEPASSVAAAPAELPFAVLLAKADPAEGQKAFAAAGCVACHTFAEGGKNGLGPNLYGVVGHKIAAHDGFVYSAALSGKGGEWSFDLLNAWLTKPAAFAPGTKMTFAGLADAKKRADIVAWLRTLSPTPVALPAAAAVPAAAAASGPAGGPPMSLGALLAAADPAAGQVSTLRLGCIACHTFTDGGKNGLGPNLYGVVGHAQASHDGYTYSAALSAHKGTWTYAELDTWLTKPAAYAAGTKMTFVGVPDPKVRANVIAYLRTLSAAPEPLPAP